MLRSGLSGCYTFDLVNAHLGILLDRHPDAGEALRELRGDREAILRLTHPDRAVAKQLFLALLYGGSVASWKVANGMEHFATEELANRISREVRELRKKDAAGHSEHMKLLKQSTPRPAEYLQYALNTAKERELIDLASGRAQEEAERLCLHSGAPAHPGEGHGEDQAGDVQEPTGSPVEPERCWVEDLPQPRLPGLQRQPGPPRALCRACDPHAGGEREHPLQSQGGLQDGFGHRPQGVVLLPPQAVDHHRGLRPGHRSKGPQPLLPAVEHRRL